MGRTGGRGLGLGGRILRELERHAVERALRRSDSRPTRRSARRSSFTVSSGVLRGAGLQRRAVRDASGSRSAWATERAVLSVRAASDPASSYDAATQDPTLTRATGMFSIESAPLFVARRSRTCRAPSFASPRRRSCRDLRQVVSSRASWPGTTGSARRGRSGRVCRRALLQRPLEEEQAVRGTRHGALVDCSVWIPAVASSFVSPTESTSCNVLPAASTRPSSGSPYRGFGLRSGCAYRRGREASAVTPRGCRGKTAMSFFAGSKRR